MKDAELIAVGIGPRYEHWDDLECVSTDTKGVVNTLRPFFTPRVPNGSCDTASELDEEVASLLGQAAPVKRLLLFWSGHGFLDTDGFYLIAPESPKPPADVLTHRNAISADNLGKLIAKAGVERVLVILDTCHSGAGANEIGEPFEAILRNQTFPGGVVPAIAIIASALPLQRATDGVFAKALIETIRDGDPGETPLWTEKDTHINLDDLIGVIEARLGPDAAQQPFFLQRQRMGKFLPNPLYKDVPAEDVETLTRRRSAGEDAEAFEQAARGIEVPDGRGWYFSGRTALLEDISKWLDAANSGMFVLTGKAGSGKSAVLGRLVTLQDSTFRGTSEFEQIRTATSEATVPPEGAVDAAVYARGKTLTECAGTLAERLGISDLSLEGSSVERLASHIAALNRPVTIVVDALDEASDTAEIADQLLRVMAAQEGVRVIVGTRPTIPTGSVLTMLGVTDDDEDVRNLDKEEATERDIAEYVKRRLLDPTVSSPYRGNDSAAEAAAAVAAAADGVFLFARITSRILLDRDTPLDLDTDEARELLRGGLKGVFDQDLRRFGSDEERARDLLRPLAWSHGAGLPRHDGIWASVATELSTEGNAYSDEDIVWILSTAGYLIIEAGEGGQTVYRLYHEYLAEYFRAE